MRLNAEVLAAVLPRTDIDPSDEDCALAEATVDALGMRGSSREADTLQIAAEFARDFRLCVKLIEDDARRGIVRGGA